MIVVVAGTFALTNHAVAEDGREYPEGYWDLVGDERIPLIQQMIEEEGMCWTAGPTSMSNLTDEEKQRRLGYRPVAEELVPPDPNPPAMSAKGLPDVFDWRTQLKCTYAENQGDCGSCWAHSPTASLESAILIYEDQRIDLSEQAIVSCVSYGWGCNGGQPAYTLTHYRDYGAVLEECMPYQANHSVPCTEDDCDLITTLDAYYAVTNTVTNIKNTIYTYGPVSTDFWVFDDFNSYQDGCYDAQPMHSANHCMLICGWDDTQCNGEGAWIVKNSWGENWGISGFCYIAYGAAGIGRGVKRLEYTPKMHLLKPGGYTVDAAAKGNGNGFLEPGETAELQITLANDGKGPATGMTGVLSTSTPGVTILDDTAIFPNINAESSGSSAAPHFEIAIDAGFTAGEWIDFQLDVTTDLRSASLYIPVYVGQFVEVMMEDVESAGGWIIGAGDDDATAGIWERAEPTEKLWNKYTGATIQPGKDATPLPGTMCFVTEDSPLGTAQRHGDVDGGKTTLLSPVFDLSSYDAATLTYSRFYTNNSIPTQTDDDPFYVDISSDNGASWVNLETVTETPEDRKYHQMVFDLGSVVALRPQMQLRFVATDYGLNSVVEAVIDDIEIRGYGSMTSTADGEDLVAPARPRALVLEQNVPNPFNPETAIAFGLPRAAEVDLGIYNIRGQRVRQLVDGWMPAGFHTELWDGRDVNGQLVSSGVYFYRLSTPEEVLTRRMTLIK
jgi:C1A family cysteine protease